MVAVGAISGDAKDSNGDTIGGIGSAIYLESFTRNCDGSYSGVMAVQPDRGHNTQVTSDYEARRHNVAFSLNPYYGSTNMTYNASKALFPLTYQNTLFYHESNGVNSTGLDALGVRNGTVKLPTDSNADNRITFDSEGLVINADGTSWVSDEVRHGTQNLIGVDVQYGPIIYKIGADGTILSEIPPPFSLTPFHNGTLNYTAAVDPTTGRVGNQGYEGLTISADGKTLYAALQSGTVQDLDKSGNGKYTRLNVYDVSGTTPVLIHSYVLTLPTTSSGKVLAQSDVRLLSPDTFIVLSRDGNGGGGSPSTSSHKDFLLFQTAGSTDIVNTAYTTGTTPISPNGTLAAGITPITPVEWISFLDGVQLGRFGMHNGGSFNVSLINSKFESSVSFNIQFRIPCACLIPAHCHRPLPPFRIRPSPTTISCSLSRTTTSSLSTGSKRVRPTRTLSPSNTGTPLTTRRSFGGLPLPRLSGSTYHKVPSTTYLIPLYPKLRNSLYNEIWNLNSCILGGRCYYQLTYPVFPSLLPPRRYCARNCPKVVCC